MPYGASWPKFLTFATAAMLSTFAGAQTIHEIYKPLADMDELVNKELEKLIDEHERSSK